MAEADNFHVAIVGAGPAGFFCAYELAEAGVEGVVIIERGRPIEKRFCPQSVFCACARCDVLEGEGGAGGFSDGKLTLSSIRGIQLPQLFSGGRRELIEYADGVLQRFGAGGRLYGDADCGIQQTAGALVSDNYQVRHVGTEGIRRAFANMASELRSRGTEVVSQTNVRQIIATEDRGFLISTKSKGEHRVFSVDNVVLATGLSGTSWAESQLARLGVSLQEGPSDLGIRIECRVEDLQDLTEANYDFKLVLEDHNGLRLRSFCVNPGGLVMTEFYPDLGIRGVNGHSYFERKSSSTNFALLATMTTNYHPSPKSFVREAARLVNKEGAGYPLVQRMDDFLSDSAPCDESFDNWLLQPSTPKVAVGQLSRALPKNLYDGMVTYLRQLAKATPGVLNEDNLVYGPEIKYFQLRVELDPETMRTKVPNLYVAGNVTGYTASIMGAAGAGIIAGRSIAKNK